VLLSELLRSAFPADLVVSNYFRQHRELGHADRGFVAEIVFAVLRRKRSLSARCADEVTSRRLLLAALACLQGMNRRELAVVLNESESKWLAHAKAVKVDDLPVAVRLDLPDWLYALLTEQFSAEEIERSGCRPQSTGAARPARQFTQGGRGRTCWRVCWLMA
jgi:16S rRNA (cytosine967-C5)-methyltransferase